MLHYVRSILFYRLSGVLNDVFAFDLPALVGLQVLSQWLRSLQYVHASVCQFYTYGRAVCFLNLCYRTCPFIPVAVYFQKSYQYPVKTVFWFIIKALPLLLNGQYIITALKLLFAIISSAFVYKHEKYVSETNHTLISAWKLVKEISEYSFLHRLCIIVILVIFDNSCFTR